MMSVFRDVIGLEHLPHAKDGRYTVGPRVTTDTDLFEARVIAATARRDREEAADLFLDALSLCTGPVFHTQEVEEESFAWIEASNLVSHWEIRITDLAAELAESCLAADDTRRAIKACEAGLRAMPTHTRCTEALMRAHAHNGDRAAVQHVYQAHVTALDLIHLDHPADSTKALYNELMDEA
jgi:DNA-binding SARP family transcriptional activator